MIVAWSSPVYAALITGGAALAVGIIGVGGTVFLAVLARKQAEVALSKQIFAQRQDQTFQDRREVYATVLRFADLYEHVLADARKNQEHETELVRLSTEFIQACEVAELIAPGDIIEHIENLREALRKNRSVNPVRGAFYTAARADLNHLKSS